VLAYQTFTIGPVEWDRRERQIRLHYALDDALQFVEVLQLPADAELIDEDPADLQPLLEALLLAGGVSYYKTCCPRTIRLHELRLHPDQASFWHDVYEKGLGEFFVRNDIDFRGLIRFPSDASVSAPTPVNQPEPEQRRILVPVGGGKDSAVTVRLLQEAGVPLTLLRIGGHPLIERYVEETNLPCLTLERRLDSQLFTLNQQGALNGHVPITAYVWLASLITARLTGHTDVALSNEASANEGNITYLGLEVNHQWSKSLEFERDLQAYLHRWTGTPLRTYSLLRPFSELRIAELFSTQTLDLPLCTSCNRNWKIAGDRPTEKWCGTCPKCAFVGLLLSAFIDRRRLTAATSMDPLANTENLPLYRELLGLEGQKPFECVGTPEETAAAFLLTHQQRDWDDTPAMQMFLTECLPHLKNPKELIASAKDTLHPHALPADMASLLPFHPHATA
jgi:hypothetical protein